MKNLPNTLSRYLRTFVLFQAYCKLCAKLYENPKETKAVKDIESWAEDSQCTTKEQFFSQFSDFLWQ